VNANLDILRDVTLEQLQEEYALEITTEEDLLYYYIITNGLWELRLACEYSVDFLKEQFLEKSQQQKNVIHNQNSI
jgi:hypothetical protein